jgi:4-diphosphocytidyl-2-C-methyl-D-erythritol kinase
MIIQGHAKRLVIDAPAKINLYLEVLGRRADGYHELDTIMTSVSLCDRLVFQPRQDAEIRLHLSVDPNFQDASSLNHRESNLVVRALQAVREHQGHQYGMDVYLHKVIPLQAGLGGGSSDAAAALVAGWTLWSGAWNPDPVAQLASQLGSDVNFFLQGNVGRRWLARCRGRGEKVEPLVNSLDLWTVIAKPPIACSTPAIFSRLTLSNEMTSIAGSLVAIEQGDLQQLGDSLFNRLAGAASQAAPDLNEQHILFANQDVLGHAMTGSGSARFALCRSSVHARAVSNRVHAKHSSRVFVARSWRSPPIAAQLRAVGFVV